MSTVTIKDAQFRVLGYIDAESDGTQTARDSQYRVLGYYDPRKDLTRDPQYRLVGYGNLLASLIR